MPRIAYFDPFSGASGNMILGALIDAGLSPFVANRTYQNRLERAFVSGRAGKSPRLGWNISRCRGVRRPAIAQLDGYTGADSVIFTR